MPRVLICFVNRPVCMVRHCLRVSLKRTPEIRDHAIQIVDRLRMRIVRTTEKYRAGAKERLNVVRHVAKPLPNQFRDLRFPAKPREWGF